MSLTLLVAPRRPALYLARGLYGLAVLLWLVCGVAAPLAQAEASAETLVSQKPFIATKIEGMGLAKDNKGVSYAVTVPQALNTLLEVVNLKTMQRAMFDELAHDGKTSAGRVYVTLPNRSMFIGTTAGEAYLFNPDKLTITELTVPEAPGLSLENGVIGDGNSLYVAAHTQSGKRLYMYNTATAAWREVGAVPEATAGLAYNNGSLYTGSLSAKPVISVTNAANGATSQLALPGAETATGAAVEGIYDDLLYVTLRGDQPQTVVYDLAAGAVWDQKPAFGQLSAMPVQPVQADKQSSAATTTQPSQLQATPVKPQSQVNNTGSATAESQTTQSTTTTGTTTPDPSHPANGQQGSQNNPASQTGPNQGTTQTPPTQTTTSPVTAPVQSSSPTSTNTADTTTQPTVAPQVVQKQYARVYFGGLGSYEPAAKSTKQFVSQAGLVPVKTNCWIDENRCVVYNSRGSFGVVHTGNRTLKLTSPSPLTGGTQAATELVTAADGTVYGYAAVEGTGVLQISSEKDGARQVIAPPSAAVTSLLPMGESVLAGTAKGTIARYEPATETKIPSFGNETAIGGGAIKAMTSLGGGILAFGLNQSSAGGALGMFDTRARKLTQPLQTVAQDQTIESLTYAHGVVYGGTSGGTLFAYNTTSRTLSLQQVSILGGKAITSLVVGLSGQLAGVSGNTLFTADPATLHVIQQKTLQGRKLSGNVVTAGAKLYASVAGKVYKVNAADLTTTQVTSGSQLTVSATGALYYVRDGALYYRAAPQQAAASAAGAQRATPSAPQFDLVSLGAKIGAGTAAIGLLLLAIPVARLLQRRPSYSLQR